MGTLERDKDGAGGKKDGTESDSNTSTGFLQTLNLDNLNLPDTELTIKSKKSDTDAIADIEEKSEPDEDYDPEKPISLVEQI